MLIISRLVGMLPAIDLNNQLVFHADKVHDIATQGFLPFEFQSQ